MTLHRSPALLPILPIGSTLRAWPAVGRVGHAYLVGGVTEVWWTREAPACGAGPSISVNHLASQIRRRLRRNTREQGCD
jgi:hypothetical protein